MRVSEAYNLGLTQPGLEFLDVDIKDDVKAFLDPRALRYIDSDWSNECISLLQSFFTEVLDSIRAGDTSRAHRLVAQLNEPNEAHLGLSRGASAGRGVGDGLAEDIWQSLSRSRAIATGLLSDLEDTVLFVDNIGHDRVSDMTINIIRGPLIKFTQDVCRYYGIHLVKGVVSGVTWDPQAKEWVQGYEEMPMPPQGGGKLLLVPKSLVRVKGIFDPGEYYRHYVLTYLQDEEIQRQGPLVRYRTRTHVPFVTKKSLQERDPRSAKEVNRDETARVPEILDKYREKKESPVDPLDHEDIASITETPVIDWDKLLSAVLTVTPGKAGADEYHRAVQELLTALFYPALDFPVREFKIHDGRKRIDIKYTNNANHGFFSWLINVQKLPAAQVVVECKNYGKEIKNPEFDQISGRFSPARGKIGLLCYRGFANKKAVVASCRDTALDDRGYIIALDDDDLKKLVEARKLGERTQFKYLLERFQELT